MNSKVKIIFVDWNGTLSTSKFFGHLDKESPDLYTKIQHALFQGGKLEHLLDPWMVGDFNAEFVIKHLAKYINVSSEHLFQEFTKSCQNMFIYPEVLKMINKIRNKNVKVAIATDNMDSFNRWTVPALKLADHFDGILNSYDLKAKKKDFDKNGESLFFGKFLRENDLKPEETVIIDDSEDKDSKLSKYGIGYIKINFGEGLIDELTPFLGDNV